MDIVTILRRADLPSDRYALCQQLRLMDQSDLFNSLFPLAIQRQQAGLPVAYAAVALFITSPKSTISCKDAVAALLPQWEGSIEEVPFYLARNFGAEAVVA